MNKNERIKIIKRTKPFIRSVCYDLLCCVFRAVLSVFFCTGHFVVVPFSLTLPTLFATFLTYL